MDLTPGPAEDQERSEEPTDCCEGEEFYSDPRGMHTFDCPVYQANVEAFAKASGWTQAEAQARVVAGDLSGLRKVGWRLVLIRRLDRYFSRRRAAVSSQRIVEAIAPVIIGLLEDQGRAAYRAGREDAAKAVESVLTNPAVTYSLNNSNALEVRAGLETVRAVTPMMTETDAIRAALEGVVTDDHR